MKIEYRIRPVTRYIVTRWEDANAEDNHNVACARQIGGEYANEETAYEVGYALCNAEHQRLGWELSDERIKYPSRPGETECIKVA
jgi:hypothetical protein